MKSKYIGQLNYCVQGYLAGTNLGKTALLLNDAVNLVESGYNVAYITLDASAVIIKERILEMCDLNSHVFDKLSVHQLSIGLGNLNELEHILMYSGSDVIIIDHLDLLMSEYKTLSHTESMLLIGVRLNYLALQYKTVVITAINMTRESYSNTGKIRYSDTSKWTNLRLKSVVNINGVLGVNGKSQWIRLSNYRLVPKNYVHRLFYTLRKTLGL